MMLDNETTLLDRLNEIVDEVHIEEVKKIIETLSKINKLKHSIEIDLSDDILYDKISSVLQKDFDVKNVKITYAKGNSETQLYKSGDTINPNYIIKSAVTNNININVYIAAENLSDYQTMSLNTYFKELSHLLYIQFVLLGLEKSTTIDPLTQLQNRISFNTEMKTLVPLAIRENMKFGVILVNIDRFRAVNDEHGDEFGDDFLKLYADVIKNNIRTSDIAVRFGGGEFLIVLINVEDEKRTMKIAEKIKDKLSEAYLISVNNDRFKKTVCVGVSMFPEDSTDINEVVKFSEMALGEARDNGRNQLLRYESDDFGGFELF